LSGGYTRRIKHVRFNALQEPEPIPKGRDYASLIESNIPAVAQHTRPDSRQPEKAIISTIAYSAEER